MDYSLTQEQQALKETIRGVISRELEPIVDEYEAREAFPVQILPILGKLGLLGLGFPEVHGGGGGHLEVAMLTEELSAVAGGACSGIMTHCIGAKMISNFGTPAQIERYLAPAIEGRLVMAIAITEPDHGSDVAGLETLAERDGDGWRVSGRKMFITNASHADAFVVLATTDRSRRKDGISMFIVDRDSPGLDVGSPLKKLGWHTSDTAPVYFDECVIPANAVLGVEGQGFQQLTQSFIYERIIMAAMGVGASRAAFDASLAYARERTQFGRPIAEFQVIKHQFADMALSLEAGRAITHWAAWAADMEPTNESAAAMAKLFTSEMAVRMADRAVQIFGGAGFMEGVIVSRIYRDAKILTIGGGTSEMMRSIIAHSLGL